MENLQIHLHATTCIRRFPKIIATAIFRLCSCSYSPQGPVDDVKGQSMAPIGSIIAYTGWKDIVSVVNCQCLDRWAFTFLQILEDSIEDHSQKDDQT